MHDKDLTIRLYRPGDESQINRIFEAAFHINRSLEEWRWKFQDNPLGKSIIVVGEIDNEIVAHIAAIPVGIKFGNQNFICYQSLDSMSDPQVNKKLIFPRVFKEMQEKIKSMQQIHFGFPNNKAHSLLTNKRIGEVDIGKLDVYSVELSILSSLFPVIGQRKFNLLEINEFDDRFTRLWERLSVIYKIAIIREKRYLNWRYLYKPDNDYKIFALGKNEIIGYIVLKVFESNGLKIGSIIDLLAHREPTVYSGILSNALAYLNSRKVDLVVCYHKDKFLKQYLSGFGFAPTSERDYCGVFAQMRLIGSNFSSQVPNELFSGESNWFLMMGDSDWM
jgi:hypothetical protein